MTQFSVEKIKFSAETIKYLVKKQSNFKQKIDKFQAKTANSGHAGSILMDSLWVHIFAM